MSDPLQQPLSLPCGATLPNRLAKSAMTEGLASNKLHATKKHEHLYGLWAKGGCGLLITGNVQIDRRVMERPGNVAIDGAEDREALKAWARAGTAGGNHLWMQIAHAGRQSPWWVTMEPMAPSQVQLQALGSYMKPRQLEEAEILDYIERFAYAARVAKETGFTGVQLHAAHGYLMSSFLSPVVNERTDQWGGSLENRARFLLESIKAVREAVGPDFPVCIKLNSADFQKGGFSFDDCLKLVEWLNDTSLDLLEISGGSYEQPVLTGKSGRESTLSDDRSEGTKKREAYFLDYAKAVRKICKVPLMVTGGFRSREVMEMALAENDLDIIGVARPVVAETDSVQQLFDRKIDTLPQHEQHLKVGNGALGADSSSFTVKMVNIFGMMGWYYLQIFRTGHGQAPNMKKGALGGLLWHLTNEIKTAWRVKSFQKKVPRGVQTGKQPG